MGTIVGEHPIAEGWVMVHWPNGKTQGYRVSPEHDLCLAPGETGAAAAIAPNSGTAKAGAPVSKETCKIGLRVVRGPSWMWKNQDGGPGHVGTVVSDVDSDSWVGVKWEYGAAFKYRVGADGGYDLCVAEGEAAAVVPTGSGASSGSAGEVLTPENLKVGLKVVRGPDW